jgi:hypothetical protein
MQKITRKKTSVNTAVARANRSRTKLGTQFAEWATLLVSVVGFPKFKN